MLNEVESKNLKTCRTVIEEIFDGKDFSRLAECYSEKEYRLQDSAHGDQPSAFSHLLPMLEYYENAFNGYRAQTVDMIARDDLVFIHWKIAGIQTGEYMGRPPTGNSFEIDAISKCKLKGGKIIEVVQLHDTYSLFQQLGFVENEETMDRQSPIRKEGVIGEIDRQQNKP